MKITYYLEILSSWCYWCEPAWAELKKRYHAQAEFAWKIALMNPGDFPISRAQCEWFYRRSGTLVHSPFMLNAGWLEIERQGHFEFPNYVSEAGKDLGFTDDRLRLALSSAALREGRTIGHLAEAVEVASSATGIDAAALLNRARSPEIEARVRASTAEFHALQVSQRPAFLVENAIGDRAVFSGLVRAEPLIAAIDCMLTDQSGYETHAAHFGSPPPF